MNTPLQIEITAIPGAADPTAEEAAAAVAAIVSLIAAGSGSQDDASLPTGRWRDAAKLVSQGLTPSRTPARPGWATIERLRRAGKGGSGITGM
jgi:hypothetical protein